MSSWRMRGVLQNPNLVVPPNEKDYLNVSMTKEGSVPTFIEMVRFYVQQLIRLSEGKQGRVQMILAELRKARLAPRARKRK